MTFGEKVKQERKRLGLSQTQLAEKIGVTLRTVNSYECSGTKPRPGVLAKLAEALGVSVAYLTDINATNPREDIEKDPYVEQARSMYGTTGARDVDALLSENEALFAGGELSQDQKDMFFEAVMKAYLMCKDEARRKFTPKRYRQE